MKISKTKLHQIIKEELQSVLGEADDNDGWGDTVVRPRSGQKLAGQRSDGRKSQDLDKTAAFTPADIEQRKKSDAAAVAKDPILNGRELWKFFFRNKEWGKQARKALKTAAAETTTSLEFQSALSSPVPMEPKTTQEMYMLKSHQFDRLERKYQKMKGDEPDFGAARAKAHHAEMSM